MKYENLNDKIKLDYKNLPEKLMVNIEDDFRKRLISEIKAKFEEVNQFCKFLGCSVSSFMYYQRSQVFIPVKIFRDMVCCCNFKDSEINSAIIQIKKQKCGKEISIYLPICASPELAALVGHALGDGHISKVGRFVYVNKEKILIDKVKSLVNQVFKNEVYFSEKYIQQGNYSRIDYLSAVGEILVRVGCIKGNRTIEDFDIPLWIKEGNKEIKSQFLRSLYDDEGCVSGGKISINMSKIENKKTSLVRLLESFKKLLFDLNIETSKLCFGQTRVSKNNIKSVNLGFLVCNYYDICNFQKNIGFAHEKKQKRLKELLSSYKRPRYKTRRDALELLNKGPLSTRELRLRLNKTKSGMKYNLVCLEKEGKIRRKIISKRKHIWIKNEENKKE